MTWTSDCGKARIVQGDCLQSLRAMPSEPVHCCVTSPPYWGLRDYGCDGQIGLEETPEAYVANMVAVFREVRRVLRNDGTLWLNLGDSYAANKSERLLSQSGAAHRPCHEKTKLPACDIPPTLKPKDLVGIPWRVAFALQADGWWLRQDIIWHKPNPMPESVTDRCTKAHEYVFLLSKSERYFYDAEAVSEAAATAGDKGLGFYPGRAGAMGRKASGNEAKDPSEGSRPTSRNRRSVWTVTTKPYSGAHFAVMPPDLVEPCVKAGCPEQCCPTCGTGYERIIEKGRSIAASSQDRFATNKKRDAAHCRNDGATIGNMNGKIWAEHKAENPDKFLGWRPACKCQIAQPVAGTVLDPFSGSGTTIAVALSLGRLGVGCELNPEYIELAKRRIEAELKRFPLFERAEGPKQARLFGD